MEPRPANRSLHFALDALGWILLFTAAAFASEVVYEQTVLTRSNGIQMIGFTLAHEHVGFLLLGMAGLLGLYAWTAAFILVAIYQRFKRGRRPPAAGWFQFGLSIVVLSVFWVPYEVWQFATVEVAGHGPRASSQMTYAAAGGHRYLVDALIRSGVTVDSSDSDGYTALAAACRTGHKELADHLVTLGAKLDAAPSCRRYPDFAASMKSEIHPNSGIPKVRGTTVVVSSPAQ